MNFESRRRIFNWILQVDQSNRATAPSAPIWTFLWIYLDVVGRILHYILLLEPWIIVFYVILKMQIGLVTLALIGHKLYFQYSSWSYLWCNKSQFIIALSFIEAEYYIAINVIQEIFFIFYFLLSWPTSRE